MTGSGQPATSAAVPGPLVGAAIRSFAAGYATATVRQIAVSAGLDPALVTRSFQTKEQLFTAVAAALIQPGKALAAFADGQPERAGERLLRYFLALLADARQPGMFLELIRSAVASEEAAGLLRQVLAERVHGEIAASLGSGQPELRTALVASQLVGIAIARHVVGLVPLAAADPDELASWVAPVLRYYLGDGRADQADAPLSWYARFESLLAEAVDDGDPSLSTVARHLAVSPRTLQRQLAAHGTTWRAELDALRRRRAAQARRSGTTKAASLVHLLGYADPRSVRRSLRRWEAGE
jgi:AcrR family transcriptional regulator